MGDAVVKEEGEWRCNEAGQKEIRLLGEGSGAAKHEGGDVMRCRWTTTLVEKMQRKRRRFCLLGLEEILLLGIIEWFGLFVGV